MPIDVDIELALAHLDRLMRSRLPRNRHRDIALTNLEDVSFRVALSLAHEPNTGGINTTQGVRYD